MNVPARLSDGQVFFIAGLRKELFHTKEPFVSLCCSKVSINKWPENYYTIPAEYGKMFTGTGLEVTKNEWGFLSQTAIFMISYRQAVCSRGWQIV